MEVECLALKDLTSPRKSVSGEPEEDGCQSEQKENICTDRRRSTPPKSAESSVPALPINRKGATPDLTHITPIKHTALMEPWTPTANLKMLISAASPDIRDREMRKVLFRPIENDKDKPGSPSTVVDTDIDDSCQFEAVDEEDDAEKKPSRKQKSLGLLCQKFLALYPDYPPLHSPIWISLDEVATSLGVERRRIYDIVNVLESVMMVGRTAKNSYTWYGRQRLEATLEDLQRKGRDQGYDLQMELGGEARESAQGHEDDRGETDASNAGGNRKEKSLRIMSQKFVMLFLVSKTQTVTLDAAAKILIEESQDSSSHSKYKTKVRRLYDIANVLTSLGLIKKVHVREERGRKPAFRWLGPVEFNKSGNSAVENTLNVADITPSEPTSSTAGQDHRKTKLARHASFNITPTYVAVQRQVSSAPSSPRYELNALPNQPVDYSTKTASNSMVCQLRFGNSSEPHLSALPNQIPHSASSSSLAPSSTHPTFMAPFVHPEHLFTSSPSPQCLAYLPSLSQPSVVMLYRAPEKPAQMPGDQTSPELERRKRRGEERGEEEESVSKKKGNSALEKCDKIRDEPHMKAAELSPSGHTRTFHSREQGFSEIIGGKPEQAHPSHFLYVPNTAGVNNLNFLLSGGQTPAGVVLPTSSSGPTLALPYVLVPSALSHYPLVPSSLQQQVADAHSNLSFSVPAMMSATHFVMGTSPYSMAASEITSGPPTPLPSTPEQSSLCGSRSPSGPRQTVSISTPEPLTPHTPKESTKAFFQTPGTLGSVVGAAPAARKRGSAQRRLDIGHPPTK